jgi:hypothetical protein
VSKKARSTMSWRGRWNIQPLVFTGSIMALRFSPCHLHACMAHETFDGSKIQNSTGFEEDLSLPLPSASFTLSLAFSHSLDLDFLLIFLLDVFPNFCTSRLPALTYAPSRCSSPYQAVHSNFSVRPHLRLLHLGSRTYRVAALCWTPRLPHTIAYPTLSIYTHCPCELSHPPQSS